MIYLKSRLKRDEKQFKKVVDNQVRTRYNRKAARERAISSLIFEN